MKENSLKYLYRYFPYSEVNRQNIENIFKYNQLYFPTPSTFNDPFDCRLKLDFNGTKIQWDNYLKGLVNKYSPHLNRFKKREQLRKMKKKAKSLNFSNQVLRSMKDEIGVLCLSEINDNILMWSYYSSGHTGFCLRFDYSIHNQFFGQALKVNYAEKYPQINFFNNSKEERMRAMLLTKAKIWKYEQEWRIIAYEKGSGLYNFSKESLSGIIWGAEMNEADKDHLSSILSENHYNISLYQSEYIDREYKLGILIV